MFIFYYGAHTLAPLRPWSCLQYAFVNMRSWSRSPPYRRTGGSDRVASVRARFGFVPPLPSNDQTAITVNFANEDSRMADVGGPEHRSDLRPKPFLYDAGTKLYPHLAHG
jgi:hypothetical protein